MWIGNPKPPGALSEKKRYESNGRLKFPETDNELFDTVPTDDDMDIDQAYKSPELLQTELCICLCCCIGSPIINSSSIPIIKYAIGYKKNGALIHFNKPLSNGGSKITGYQITSIPDNIIKTGKKSPIKIKGLNIGILYKFVVPARNRTDLVPPSA